MTDEDRPRWIERGQPERTPAEKRRNRAGLMVFFGVIALLWGGLAVINGAVLGWLLALLGIALLVGGLVM